jgi:hypothetical protein
MACPAIAAIVNEGFTAGFAGIVEPSYTSKF